MEAGHGVLHTDLAAGRGTGIAVAGTRIHGLLVGKGGIGHGLALTEPAGIRVIDPGAVGSEQGHHLHIRSQNAVNQGHDTIGGGEQNCAVLMECRQPTCE